MQTVKIILSIVVCLILVSCSGPAKKGQVGECYRHKWENGLWAIRKASEDQAVLEEISENEGEAILGKVKVVGPLYGGWYQVPCPKHVYDKVWEKKK